MNWRLGTGWPQREVGRYATFEEACAAWAELKGVAHYEASVQWIGNGEPPPADDLAAKLANVDAEFEAKRRGW